MNKHYDNYLVRKYAPLYKQRHLPMNQTAMCWGFEVGDGWFNIINNLSLVLCASWLRAKKDFDRIDGRIGETVYADDNFNAKWNPIITAEMIEAKRQKMNEEVEKVPTVVQVKEKFGTLRFYVEGATEEQRTMISFAELLTASTCEECGRPGKSNSGGWIRVRCKEHR